MLAACFWPGVVMYDTVAQYGQVLSGDVDDWHPPIMVRLWQLLHGLASRTAPMFAVQTFLYGSGWALIVAALARNGRFFASFAAVILALSPLLLGWQMVVLKDAQMQGALIASFGIAVHYRLQNRKVPVPAGAMMALLMVYATLVRANAIFVTAPLVVLLLPRPKSMVARAPLILLIAVVTLGITPLINHQTLGARPSDVAKSEPVFDLAAIAVAVPSSASVFTPAELKQISRAHCVKAFFWDPLGDPSACASATERLIGRPAEELYLDLGRAAVAHPIAYLEHRLEHWNSSERWLVAPGLPDAAPPIEAEPNDLGLGTPSSPVAAAWQDLAAVEAATPIGWPIFWTAASLCLLPAAWRRRCTPVGDLAIALLLSGLALEFSFLVISIASDLRYHLWPMCAAPLALVLLSDKLELKRREWLFATALLGIIAAGGLFARSSLPRAPDSYQGMIHSVAG